METGTLKWMFFIEIFLIITAVVNMISAVEWIVVMQMMPKPESVEEWLKYVALNEKWFNRGLLSVIAVGFYSIIRWMRYYAQNK